MKIQHLLLCLIILSVIPLGLLAETEPAGKISFPMNRVFVIRSGSTEMQQAGFNMAVFAGDKIETKKESRCEITLTNGDVVRIDENSIYTLDKVKITEKTTQVESSLGLGKLWSTVKKVFSKDDYYKVKSPSAVIAVRGTIYRVNVNPDSSTQLRVYQGAVEAKPAQNLMGESVKPQKKPNWPPSDVAGPGDVAGPRDVSMEEWVEIVKAQQQIYIMKDGKFQKSEFDMTEDGKSDWVKWNKQRDELLNR